MKNVIVFFMLASLVASANSTLLGGSISLTRSDYLPFPAQPGGYIDFFTGVANDAATAAAGVQCRLEPEFPFSVDANEQPLREIGILAPRQSVLLKYKVRVDDNAVAGDNELKFSCKVQGGEWVTAKLSVFVQPKDAILTLTGITVNPDQVTPGGKASIRIHLKNSAKVSLTDVSVSLMLNDTTLPFAPLAEGSFRRLGLLKPAEEEIVQFEVVSSPEAVLKVYKIPLVLTYFDALGKQYSKIDLVGVAVSGKPELLVTTEPDVLKPEKAVKFSLRVSNAGISDAKFLTVRLKSAQGVRVLSNTEAYLGTISSDNFETVTFQLVFEKAGVYTLPLELMYKDASNNNYQTQSTVTANVYSEEEAMRLGFEKRPDWTLPALAILVIGVYLAWRLFRKKSF